MIIFNILLAIGKLTRSGFRDETDLVKRIQERDEEALEQLYELYKRLLFGLTLSIVKKRDEAEDLLQEVFITVWNKASTFEKERGNVYGWIVTLARNKAIDHVRSRSYRNQELTSSFSDEATLGPAETQHDPLETTIFSDRTELVKKALQEIPENQSEILKIAYYRGMTQSEIAEYLDIPLGTVKTRMRQGMIKLKSILSDTISGNDR